MLVANAGCPPAIPPPSCPVRGHRLPPAHAVYGTRVRSAHSQALLTPQPKRRRDFLSLFPRSLPPCRGCGLGVAPLAVCDLAKGTRQLLQIVAAASSWSLKSGMSVLLRSLPVSLSRLPKLVIAYLWDARLLEWRIGSDDLFHHQLNTRWDRVFRAHSENPASWNEPNSKALLFWVDSPPQSKPPRRATVCTVF